MDANYEDLTISLQSPLSHPYLISSALHPSESSNADMTGGGGRGLDESFRNIVQLCLLMVNPGNLGIVDSSATYAPPQLRPKIQKDLCNRLCVGLRLCVQQINTHGQYGSLSSFPTSSPPYLHAS